nr:hypothetical protein [Ralstonia mannitolilytica]
MEPQTMQAGPRTGLLPCMVVNPPHRGALVVEDVALLLLCLLRQHCQCVFIERHRDHLPRLCLVGMNPCHCAVHVDLRPLQQPNVGFPQPGRQRETRHLPQVRWQLGEQALRLRARQPGKPSIALRQLADGRDRIDPALRVTVMQYDRQRGHVAIHRGASHAVLQLRLDDGLDAVAADVPDTFPFQLSGEPAQALLGGLQRPQVLVLFKPVHNCGLPSYRRPLAELLLPPVIVRNLGGKLFRRPAVRGASRLSNSRAVDAEVEPPRTGFLSFVEPHFSVFSYRWRSQSITSTSTKTQARPTFAAGRPWCRMHSETVSGVVNSHAAASSKFIVLTVAPIDRQLDTGGAQAAQPVDPWMHARSHISL